MICRHCHKKFTPKNPQHRIIAGDIRDPDVVAQLMAGVKANVVITSPPYASQREYDKSSGFKPIPPDEYVEWFMAVSDAIIEVLALDGSYFLNIKAHCEDGERSLYVMDLVLAHKRGWGWRFRDEFIWKHSGFPGEYKYRHRNQFEPIYHFSRQHEIKHRPLAVGVESDLIRDNSDGHMAATNAEGDKDRGKSLPFKSGIAQVGNCLEIPVNSDSSGHVAAYPVGLPDFFIKAFSDPGDIISDPFLGSGTTIVAAEQLGRAGYGCEISPAYVAVCLERLSALGLKARLSEVPALS